MKSYTQIRGLGLEVLGEEGLKLEFAKQKAKKDARMYRGMR